MILAKGFQEVKVAELEKKLNQVNVKTAIDIQNIHFYFFNNLKHAVDIP